MPGGGGGISGGGGRLDRTTTTDAVSGGGGRTTFAFAEILETARSSTLDDLGSLLETIAEARQQQQQQQQTQAAAKATTTEAEAAEAEVEEAARKQQQRRQQPLPRPTPPPPQRPRPRFVAVHPSCASHAIKAKKQKKKNKSNRFRPFSSLRLLPLPLRPSPPQLQLLLQAAAAVGLSSCFVLVDALAFRQACLAVGFALIVMLIASSSAAVGSRLVSCASFGLPLALGAVGGGVAASLAWEVAGVSVVERFSPSSSSPAYYARAKEPQFTIALVGFNLFVLALASAWR